MFVHVCTRLYIGFLCGVSFLLSFVGDSMVMPRRAQLQVFSIRGDGRLFANSIQVEELIHLSSSAFASFVATTGGGTILGGGLTVRYHKAIETRVPLANPVSG